MLFNDLLRAEGIAPEQTRLLRHHTKRGLGGMTLHDLWQRDRKSFELYQSTQKPGQPKFRTARYFASFVCPTPDRTLFVGLYDTQLVDTRQVEWRCPYRGNLPGGGKPVDVFITKRRRELAGQIGSLEIAWPTTNVRVWTRYADKAPFAITSAAPFASGGAPLVGPALVAALAAQGFERSHETKRLIQMRRGSLVVYAKRSVRQHPLVVHFRYRDMADRLAAIEGVAFDRPLRPAIDSNLSDFPVYTADHRTTASHQGFALDVTLAGLPRLVDALVDGASIMTPNGRVRVIGTNDDPLTERERLAAARIGQGGFRDALITLWEGRCPVAAVDHAEMLRASHIKPWKVSSNRERLDPYNGLLLSAHIDALFDRGLISFEDDGHLIVSEELSAANLRRMGLRTGLRLRGLDARHLPYLAFHRRDVLRA